MFPMFQMLQNMWTYSSSHKNIKLKYLCTKFPLNQLSIQGLLIIQEYSRLQSFLIKKMLNNRPLFSTTTIYLTQQSTIETGT